MSGPGDEASSHAYLSTACHHGEHGYCAASTGLAGPKKPAQCKFCEAPCICECHAEQAAGRDAVAASPSSSVVDRG